MTEKDRKSSPAPGDPERARLAEELSAERSRRQAAELGLATLQAAFSKMDGGVLVLDSDRVVYANPAIADLFGIPSERLQQMGRDQFVREVTRLFDDTPDFLERLRDRSAATLDTTEDFEMPRPRWRRLRWVGKALKLPSGKGQLGLFTDITADSDLATDRERRALTDDLTDLANRRAGEQYASREIARAQRTGRPLSFVMFDVDHFKRVNDGHGHLAGDVVLKEVSRCLRNHLRAGDEAVRWGGEEFLVILADTAGEEARSFGERVRREIELQDFDPVGRITISAGVAEFVHGEDIDSAIARADGSLYQAKSLGRNRVV